jgi:LacI family transcriptional regulator
MRDLVNEFTSSSVNEDEPEGQHARLGDVALAAGVSKATASYVMNGRPGISERTRERVLAAAAELGYRPTRRPAPATTGQIGVILSATLSTPDGHPNYYVAELLAGVEAEIATQGFRLQATVWSGELPAMVRERDVAGVVFLGGSFPVEVARQCELPAVLVGTSFPQWPYDSVLADNRQGAYLAVRHLIGHGRRRVALVNGPETTRTSESKLLGYRDALVEHGVPFDPELVGAGDFSPESASREMARLLDSNDDIDGVFVADDPMAIGVLRTIEARKLTVPADIAVIGYGDSPMGAVVTPALSTVRVFQRQLGTMGARRLLNRLIEEDHAPVQTLISPELVLRGTTP